MSKIFKLIKAKVTFLLNFRMAIILLILKPFMVLFILRLARDCELDHGEGQNASLVDSFPSFGNWKSGYGPTSTATYQNSNNVNQQQPEN